MFSFHLPENIRKTKVSLCFQGMAKEDSGKKKVKTAQNCALV